MKKMFSIYFTLNSSVFISMRSHFRFSCIFHAEKYENKNWSIFINLEINLILLFKLNNYLKILFCLMFKLKNNSILFILFIYLIYLIYLFIEYHYLFFEYQISETVLQLYLYLSIINISIIGYSGIQDMIQYNLVSALASTYWICCYYLRSLYYIYIFNIFLLLRKK